MAASARPAGAWWEVRWPSRASYQGVFRNPLAIVSAGRAAGAGLRRDPRDRARPPRARAAGHHRRVRRGAVRGRSGVGPSPRRSARRWQRHPWRAWRWPRSRVRRRRWCSRPTPRTFATSTPGILGSLGTAQWIRLILPYVAVAILLASGRALDVLAVGDDEAYLGVRPGRVRLVVLLAASLGTAGAVAVSGLIGFVGLSSRTSPACGGGRRRSCRCPSFGARRSWWRLTWWLGPCSPPRSCRSEW